MWARVRPPVAFLCILKRISSACIFHKYNSVYCLRLHQLPQFSTSYSNFYNSPYLPSPQPPPTTIGKFISFRRKISNFINAHVNRICANLGHYQVYRRARGLLLNLTLHDKPLQRQNYGIHSAYCHNFAVILTSQHVITAWL